MNRILLFLSAVLLSTGCIINGGGGSVNDPGNINVYWTIVGARCADHLEVARIRVTIPGEELASNGEFGCTNNGVDGIQLKDFAGKTYAVTVEAFNNQHELIYTGTENVTVNGDASVKVDLVPPSTNGNTSYARLFWTLPKKFSDSPTPVLCSHTDVTKVKVYIDNAVAPEVYDCAAGQTVSGVQTPFLAPGTHTIRLEGTDATGYVYLRQTSTLTTVANDPADASFSLDWAVGGTKIRWQLTRKSDGSNISCADAKVSTVFINFQETATGRWLYAEPDGDPMPGFEEACAASGGGVIDYYYDALPPGDWQVFVQGESSDATPVLYNNFAAPETVAIVAGQFATEATVAKQVLMKEQ